jgi:CMP-N-acetylneuraminic acid synthetase
VNGAIYIALVEHLRDGGGFVERSSALFGMSQLHGLDIDCEFDLDVARSLVAAGMVRAAPAGEVAADTGGSG